MDVSVILTCHWVTLEKPLINMKDIRKLQKKSMIGAVKQQLMEILVVLADHWVTIGKRLSSLNNI